MNPSPRLQHAGFLLLLFTGVGIALLALTWDLRPFPIPASVDDYRYVRSAIEIKQLPGKLLSGAEPLNWLGPYDPTTLFKRPGFSIVLAAVSALHLPFLQTFLLFHLVALAILANSLLNLGYSRLTVGLTFIAAGLYPTLYDSNGVRVIRETAASATEIAIFGLCLSLLSLRPVKTSRLFLNGSFAVLLALLGLHWSMREEAALLLPAVILMVSGAAWLSAQSMKSRLKYAALATILVLLPSQVARLVFSTLNKASYGVWMTHDISEGSFPRAINALKRVDEAECDYRLLAPEEIPRVAAASPTFGYISGPLTTVLAEHPDMLYGESFATLRMNSLDGNIGGSPVLTQRVFSRIAREVQQACTTGGLRCADQRTRGIVPWLCGEQWDLVPRYFVAYLTEYIAPMRHSGLSPLWSGTPGVGRLQPAELEAFEEITRQKMAGRHGDHIEFSKPASLSRLEAQDALRSRVGRAYAAVMPWLMAGASIGFLLIAVFRIGQLPAARIIVLSAMAIHVLCRAAAFSYLSAIEGYLNTRFIEGCYPVAAAFAVLGCTATRNLFRPFRQMPGEDLSRTERPIRRWPRIVSILPALALAAAFIYMGKRPGMPFATESSAALPDSLRFDGDREVFQWRGRRIETVSQRQGWLNPDAGSVDGDFVVFTGWGMDVVGGKPAEAIVVFANGVVVAETTTTTPVPSVESGFPEGTHAGFLLKTPTATVTGRKVRVFAIFGGNLAGELNYPPSFPFRD